MMMMMIVLHVVGGYHRLYNEEAFYVTLKNMFLCVYYRPNNFKPRPAVFQFIKLSLLLMISVIFWSTSLYAVYCTAMYVAV